MCRKVAVAKHSGDRRVEIWGDGLQTRSFCYIDDCVEGLYRLMASDYAEPLNLGQDRLISIADLADLVARDRRRRDREGVRRRPAGRARAQLRQHPAAGRARLGAGDLARGRPASARTRGSSSRCAARLAAGGDDEVVSEELIRAD